jgi:general secretion pathway protein D
VYGLELEALAERDRLLLFARGELSWEVSQPDPETILLRARGAVLDPSAPRRLAPRAPGAITAVAAFEPAGADPPEVHVVVQRAAGPEPSVSQRGAMFALELDRPAAPPPATPALSLPRGEIPLADLVRRVAEATGERFVHEAELEGRISLQAPEALAAGEALELLHAALLIHGRVALPDPGGAWRIVPVLSAAEGAPVADPDAAGGTPVTAIVRVHDPEGVLQALQPHVGGAGVALAHAPSQSLVLAGPAPNVRRWRELAEALDRAEQETLWVRRLRARGAEDLAPLLAALAEARSSPARIAPDARTDSLLVRARAEEIPLLREWIERLDEPVEGALELRVLRVTHADPEVLADILNGLAAHFGPPASAGPARPRTSAPARGQTLAVAVDRPTHSLVVRADAATQGMVADLVRELDREPQRIEVEVFVIEVTTAESLELGFDAFLPLTEPSSPDDWLAFLLSTPSGQPLLTPGTPSTQGLARFTRAPLVVPIVGPGGIPVTAVVPRETFQVTAQDSRVRAHLLMHPRLRVASGETHELFAGDEVPVPTAAAADASAPDLAVNQNIDRREVGLDLRVKPRLATDQTVELELELEVSRVAPSQAGAVEDVGPTFSRRVLETTVRLDDGRWAVVALGPEAGIQQVERGVPWLKDIPFLGVFVKANRDVVARRELMVAARASVVREPAAREP